MTEITKEDLETVPVVHDEQINDLIRVIDATVNAFAAHPQTPNYNFAQVISAMTHLLAVYTHRGGCVTEEMLATTKKHFADNFERSVRDIWDQVREARETDKNLS